MLYVSNDAERSKMTALAKANGRPPVSPEKLDKVLERIANGESVKAICADKDMPGEKTIYSHLEKDEAFQQRYARAREAQMDHYAEEIIEISDDSSRDYVEKQNSDGSKYQAFDAEHVQRSRLRVDSRKWLMSKLAPKKYGDKVQVGGDPGNPIRQITRIERVIVDPRGNARPAAALTAVARQAAE
jgi:hypothetical protein